MLKKACLGIRIDLPRQLEEIVPFFSKLEVRDLPRVSAACQHHGVPSFEKFCVNQAPQLEVCQLAQPAPIAPSPSVASVPVAPVAAPAVPRLCPPVAPEGPPRKKAKLPGPISTKARLSGPISAKPVPPKAMPHVSKNLCEQLRGVLRTVYFGDKFVDFTGGMDLGLGPAAFAAGYTATPEEAKASTEALLKLAAPSGILARSALVGNEDIF
ncbi:unnamed protein product, partial [Cladocopium goreaui]